MDYTVTLTQDQLVKIMGILGVTTEETEKKAYKELQTNFYLPSLTSKDCNTQNIYEHLHTKIERGYTEIDCRDV